MLSKAMYLKFSNDTDMGIQETIKFLDWVDVAENHSIDQLWLIVVTNIGFYILSTQESGRPCRKCPLTKFCPDGPGLEAQFRFEEIDEVIDFEILPQRLVINFIGDSRG